MEQTIENKPFVKLMYKVKKQTLSLDEFLDFKTWVCSRIISQDELEVNYDYLDIIMQFAFAKYYLDINLPNIDSENFLDDYDLVSSITSYDYYNYINVIQYRCLVKSINKYLDKTIAEYDEIKNDEKRYSVDNFMKDISKSITNFTDTMSKNFKDVNINEVVNTIEKFQDLTDGKIGFETFIEHAKQVVENEQTSKENLVESIVTTDKKAS